MALQLDAATGNISTPSGDVGTYSWADIVALGSSKMDIYGDTAKPFYRWRGILEINTANLINKNIDIELYGISTSAPGIIRAVNGGKIYFGELVNGKAKSGCNIKITRKFYDSSNDYTLYAPISYTKVNRNDTTSRVYLYNTRLFYTSLALIPTYQGRLLCFITEARNCLMSAEDLDSANQKLAIVYFQGTHGVISSVQTQRLSIELISTITVSDLSTTGAENPILAYIGYILGQKAYVRVSSISNDLATVDYYRDQSTGFIFLDSPSIVLSNGRTDTTEPTAAFPIAESSKVFTQNIKVVDAIGAAISTAAIVYTGKTNLNLSSPTGIFYAELVVEETNISSVAYPGSYTQYPRPIPTVSTPNYVREIKNYLHTGVKETPSISAQLGTASSPFVVALSADLGVTQSNTAVVAAYTGLTHTTTTITVSQSRTLDQIYDSRKLYWRNNTGVNPPYKESDVFNLGGASLVVSGVALVASSQFAKIKTTGTVTYLNGGSGSGLIVEDSVGISVPITVTGAVTGTSIRVFQSPIDTYPTPLLSGLADSSGKLVGKFLYPGADVPVVVVARLFGYLPFNSNNQVNALITSTGLSLTVSMSTDSYA